MELGILKYWNNRANTYSEMINKDMNSFKKEVWAKIIKDKVADKNKVKVLEIGTDPGFFAIIMAQMGHDVTAAYCSCAMLEEAKVNAELAGVKVNFIKSDGQELYFKNKSFDLIISRNVDWNLKELKKVYKNWFNLLKKDGRVVIFGEGCCLKVLIECGFQKIIVEKDILNSIYTNKEKVVYRRKNMFSICAYKSYNIIKMKLI